MGCHCLLQFSQLSHVQLFCDTMDYSPPVSSVYGISQARIQEQVAVRDLPDPGIKPTSSALTGIFFTTEPPGKPLASAYLTAK